MGMALREIQMLHAHSAESSVVNKSYATLLIPVQSLWRSESTSHIPNPAMLESDPPVVPLLTATLTVDGLIIIFNLLSTLPTRKLLSLPLLLLLLLLTPHTFFFITLQRDMCSRNTYSHFDLTIMAAQRRRRRGHHVMVGSSWSLLSTVACMVRVLTGLEETVAFHDGR